MLRQRPNLAPGGVLYAEILQTEKQISAKGLIIKMIFDHSRNIYFDELSWRNKVISTKLRSHQVNIWLVTLSGHCSQNISCKNICCKNICQQQPANWGFNWTSLCAVAPQTVVLCRMPMVDAIRW